MNIRPLSSDDEPLLDEMLYLALWRPEGSLPFPRTITRDPALHRYVALWFQLPGDAGFAAQEPDGRVLGAIWLRLLPEPGGYAFWDSRTPELSMAVIPEVRNKGIGTTLLASALAHARSHFPAVSLSVASANPALRLYKRFGFTEREQRGDSIVMVRAFERPEETLPLFS